MRNKPVMKADRYISEAKAIRSEAEQTGDYKKIYNERYLKSDHWKALHEDVRTKRPERCEFCRVDRASATICLHHLKYESWHDIKIYDLLWLCKKHHDIVHQYIDPPTRGASTFLAIETMHCLASHELQAWQTKAQRLESNISSLELNLRTAQNKKPEINRQIQQPAQEPQSRTLQHPSEKSNGIPTWLTTILMGLSFAIGITIGALVTDSSQDNQSTERQPSIHIHHNPSEPVAVVFPLSASRS